MGETFQAIKQAVADGNMELTEENVRATLETAVSAADILHKGLIPAMDEVGRLFEEGALFVPEMLIAARAMKAGLFILKPLLVESGVEPLGKVVIGSVQGDLHDIGKNLVVMLLEGAGFEIVDLGTDVSPEEFVTAIESGADIVGFSALLTTTMTNMENIINAIKAAGLRSKVKIIVGGAPVTDEFANQIGADGYAPDASKATTLAKHLVS
jgi:5-methyltetrahydrofolate--homocysteine methyltransferase